MAAISWPTAMERYRLSQLAANRSPGTIRLHRYRLQWLQRLARTPAAVTLDLLHEVVGRAGWAPETRKSVRSTYRSFFSWAALVGLIDHDPSQLLPTIRVPAPVPRPTPEAVLADALRRCDDRMALMLMLAAYGGLRAHEIAKVHSADLIGDELLVLGKGRKVRPIPIVHPTLLLRLRAVEGYAFPNRWTGQPLTSGTVTKLVSAAMPAGWTCHTLRHRMASRAYDGTRDLLVGRVLGHSRPETTQRYVKLPDDALRAAVAAAAA